MTEIAIQFACSVEPEDKLAATAEISEGKLYYGIAILDATNHGSEASVSLTQDDMKRLLKFVRDNNSNYRRNNGRRKDGG